ncbi:MAG: hypothetical protein KZQ89_17460 [Candidatus Thiodiazotropha sp. (ex Lucinoma kastoroae)]|nr:hypothetical protein [Candidatus Thiodiazotropha sp. (ex Lucinoma kastoroae)]
MSHEQNALGQIIESIATNPPGSGSNRCWADQIPNSTSLSGQLISGVVVKHDAHPNNQDRSDIQGLLQRMTTGMGVALNTTLMGLSCSMLLGMQYLMLDRAADRLVAEAIQFTETRLFKATDQGE